MVMMHPQARVPARSVSPGQFLAIARYWRCDRAGVRADEITRHVRTATISANDNTEIKRTLDLDLFDDRARLRPLIDHVQVDLTIVTPDGAQERGPLGQYVVMPSRMTETAVNRTGTIRCNDLTYFLQFTTLADGFTAPANVDIGEIITGLLLDAGFSDDQIRIPVFGERLSSATPFDPGDTVLSICNSLANGASHYTLWMNSDAQLTTMAYRDLLTATPRNRYTTANDGGVPFGRSIELDPEINRLRNKVTVRNLRPDQDPIVWTAINTNPASPLWIDRPFADGGLGERAETVDDSDITSEAAARTRAEHLLQLGESYYQRLKITTGPDIHLDAHDVVDLSIVRNRREIYSGRWWRQAWELRLPANGAATLEHTLNRVEPWT